LVCTLNASRVLDAACRLLGVDHAELSRLALSAPLGAGGLVLVPYLEGERTPNRPDDMGALHGLRPDNLTPANLARAAVEGMLCGLADGLDELRRHGVEVARLHLIGGGARSEAVQRIAPDILGVDIEVPPPGEYVAVGAARQAAWALSGAETPPDWRGTGEAPVRHGVDADGTVVRERYAAVRELTARRW
jgi:xylulokinase